MTTPLPDDEPGDDRVVREIPPGASPLVTVVDAVGEVADEPLADLPSLADTVDPDALDAIFARDGGDRDGVREVSFEYGGYEVRILDGESVIVERGPR